LLELPQSADLKLLFVPVSGAYGMGEYARSLSIARAASDRWPRADIRFLLSRQAPYAANVPFPATLLPSSPTFHSAQVIRQLQEFRPHIVIFDNAGRTAQLRAARHLDARIVYISARARQRAKAFRLRWMRLIDEHWIAYPEFTAGALTTWERFKLRVMHRPVVRYLDVILARASSAAAPPPREVAASYALLVPGGGTGHPGTGDAVEQFRIAARSLAAAGTPTIFVGPARQDVTDDVQPGLRCLPPLPQAELMALMRSARLVIANGGSTLLQAIACGCACVAVPIAGDQRQRIAACVKAQVARACSLSAADILATSQALLKDEPQRAALASRAVALKLKDGVQIAVNALAAIAAGAVASGAAATVRPRP
jgi:predicted glycosyltransferase